MTDILANPTDAAICGLLAAGPLPTAALAERLGSPERSVRHRLYRLRQAGSVVTDLDGLHHLAAPPSGAPLAGPGDLAAPDRAVPEAPASRPGGRPGAVRILAAVAVGVAVGIAGSAVIAIARRRRMAPPRTSPPPVPPLGFVDLGAPWGGMPW